MPITMSDLESFHTFALGKLQNGGAPSMSKLVDQWESDRELKESVAEIRESMADADAGRLIPAEDVYAQAERALGMRD